MDDDAGALLPVGLREAVETWLTQRGRTFSWGDDPATLNVGDARLHLGAYEHLTAHGVIVGGEVVGIAAVQVGLRIVEADVGHHRIETMTSS